MAKGIEQDYEEDACLVAKYREMRKYMRGGKSGATILKEFLKTYFLASFNRLLFHSCFYRPRPDLAKVHKGYWLYLLLDCLSPLNVPCD